MHESEFACGGRERYIRRRELVDGLSELRRFIFDEARARVGSGEQSLGSLLYLIIVRLRRLEPGRFRRQLASGDHNAAALNEFVETAISFRRYRFDVRKDHHMITI